MVGKINTETYDVKGKPTGTPKTKKARRLFHGTFPMGRYVSQPLACQCDSMKEMRRFLQGCKYVSDKEQFNREDYWMPPEEFEERKKGDCDDFALWTWRQLLGMGYKARYVVGRAGKYGEGHAWVTMEKDGKHFLVEPLAAFVGEALPRLSVVRYEPKGSVEWDGEKLHYFMHENPEFRLSLAMIPILVGEWLVFWGFFWLRTVFHILLRLCYLTRKFIRKYHLPFPS